MTTASDGPDPTYLLEPRLIFDAALLGWGQRPGDPTPIAIYDYDKTLAAIQFWLEGTADEAIEWLETNTTGSWMGAGTPIVLRPATPQELDELIGGA